MKTASTAHCAHILVLALAGALGGCGGGDDGLPDTPALSSMQTALSLVMVESAGMNCAEGGVRITAGDDADANGVLGSAEVTSTRFVCNGAPGVAGAVGADGLQYLLSTTSEPAGAHCASGGQRIDAGSDTNRNLALEAAEVTSRTFVCNGAAGVMGPVGPVGAMGPTGPAGASLQWVNVTSSFAQASSNFGYLANSNSFVSILLPSSPQVGEVVRVSGAGAGGWGILQNAGQRIITAGVASTSIGAVWSPRDVSRYWVDVRSSSDGTKLIASDFGGKLYTSTDAGATWTPRESDRNWHGLGSSADGTKLVAGVSGGNIYTSTDSGLTWTARDAVRGWFRVDSSADGTRLVAVAGNQILTSRDSGVTWTASVPDANEFLWSVASSADGTRLVAGGISGRVYVSMDAGASWAARLFNASWAALAISADGMRIYAGHSGASLHVSSDGGSNWNALNITGNWNALFTSADGLRVTAAEYGGRIQTSTDGGATWVARQSIRNWNGLAGSADGTKLIAVAEFETIYSSIASTGIGNTGMLSGKQFDAVELQYLGGGTYTVLSYTGRLNVVELP